jgi:hypothetical protein
MQNPKNEEEIILPHCLFLDLWFVYLSFFSVIDLNILNLIRALVFACEEVDLNFFGAKLIINVEIMGRGLTNLILKRL